MEQRKGLSGSTLKIIAMVSMLTDHCAYAVIENGYLPKLMRMSTSTITGDFMQQAAYLTIANFVLRQIGRIAFPIFCFLLIEGFYHTRNVWKYLAHLVLFGLLSEIPFDMMISHSYMDWQHQNVYFTLAIGLLVVILADRAGRSEWLQAKSETMVLLCRWVIAGAGMALAFVMKTDYNAIGVLLIYILYEFHHCEWKRNLCGSLVVAFELSAPLAFVFTHFYNGKRGISLKYVFYLFYPVHLLILGWISMHFI